MQDIIRHGFVSTLSRPKAAGLTARSAKTCISFNTQPPEGGCRMDCPILSHRNVSTLSRPKAAVPQVAMQHLTVGFQHSAARRRLYHVSNPAWVAVLFQHSAARRRLLPLFLFRQLTTVSTLSRPKAAAWSAQDCIAQVQFQHSAARRRLFNHFSRPFFAVVSTLSRPKAADRPRW